MLTSVFLTLYGILKFVNHGVHKDAFDYIMIVEEVVYQVSNIALIAPLYKEYTWRLSKKLGVDKNVRSALSPTFFLTYSSPIAPRCLHLLTNSRVQFFSYVQRLFDCYDAFEV
jgi:hypothetical protein